MGGERVNRTISILGSAARTTLQTGTDQVNDNYSGVEVVVDITGYTAGGLTITIQGKDEVSGKYFTLLTSAVLAAAATTRLVVYPGVTVAANLAVSTPLSRIFRVNVAVSDATSITYSIGAALLQ